jgi:hypothetical protein
MTTTTTPAKPTTPPIASPVINELHVTEQQRATFAKAHASITEAYDKSPSTDELMRMWLSGATPWQVMRYFEESVLHISGSELAGTDDDQILLNL